MQVVEEVLPGELCERWSASLACGWAIMRNQGGGISRLLVRSSQRPRGRQTFLHKINSLCKPRVAYYTEVGWNVVRRIDHELSMATPRSCANFDLDGKELRFRFVSWVLPTTMTTLQSTRASRQTRNLVTHVQGIPFTHHSRRTHAACAFTPCFSQNFFVVSSILFCCSWICASV